jgi:hypothetical protein
MKKSLKIDQRSLKNADFLPKKQEFSPFMWNYVSTTKHKHKREELLMMIIRHNTSNSCGVILC